MSGQPAAPRGIHSSPSRRVAGSCRRSPDCSGARLRWDRAWLRERTGPGRRQRWQLEQTKFAGSFRYDLITERTSAAKAADTGAMPRGPEGPLFRLLFPPFDAYFWPALALSVARAAGVFR